MKRIIITSLLFFSFIKTYPQILYPAPEIWSSPEIIQSIDDWSAYSASPSIDLTGNKLYFEAGYISMVEKTDTGWGTPKSLNSNVNQNLARTPCISPNGKRLFFSWYVGGWDLYYSDWDSVTNDWGLAVSCGEGVNNPEDIEVGCTLPDDTTLIFMRNGDGYISSWDNSANQWSYAKSFPTDDLRAYSIWGIHMTQSRNKYYNVLPRSDSINQDQDIYVYYRDASNPSGYSIPYILNIYLEADSLFKSGKYISRAEGYPNLTPDGRTMYFAGGYKGFSNIYVSHLLIDENGEPVYVKYDNQVIPKSIILYPPYPNPFNPSTVIKYQLPNDSHVSLKVFDILGNEVKVLVNDNKPAGTYHAKFNGEGLASGVYIYSIRVNSAERQFVSSKKMILAK